MEFLDTLYLKNNPSAASTEIALMMENSEVKLRNLAEVYLKTTTLNVPSVLYDTTVHTWTPTSTTKTLTLKSQTAKQVFAAPIGASGTPSFRVLELDDISDYGNGLTNKYVPVWNGTKFINSNAISSGGKFIVGSTTETEPEPFQVYGSAFIRDGFRAVYSGTTNTNYIGNEIVTDASTYWIRSDSDGTKFLRFGDTSFNYNKILLFATTIKLSNQTNYTVLGTNGAGEIESRSSSDIASLFNSGDLDTINYWDATGSIVYKEFGLVGIGNTDPYAKLHVGWITGSNSILISGGVASGNKQSLDFGQNAPQAYVYATIKWQYDQLSGSGLQFNSTTGFSFNKSDLYGNKSGTAALSILTSSNYVIIGGSTSLGAYPFQAHGASYFKNTAYFVDSSVPIEIASTSAIKLRLKRGTGTVTVGMQNNTNSIFWDLGDNGADMLFNTTGLAIGHYTPNDKLDVFGGAIRQRGTNSIIPTTTISDYNFSFGAGSYGVFAGVTTAGISWIQSGRSDTSVTYNLLLNPRGGGVGIGLSVPTGVPLEINGDTRSTIGSGGTFTAYDDNVTRKNRIILGADVSGAYITSTYGSSGSKAIVFRQVSTEVGRFHTDGNFGLGIVPSERVHVYSNDNTTVSLRMHNVSTGTSARTGIMFTNNVGSAYMFITSSTYTGVSGWANRLIISNNSDISGGIMLRGNSVQITGDSSLNSPNLYVAPSGTVVVGSRTPIGSYAFQVFGSTNNTAQISATINPTLRLLSTNYTIAQNAIVGSLEFYSSDGDMPRVVGSIRMQSSELYSRAYDLTFYTSNINTAEVENMRLNKYGHLLVTDAQIGPWEYAPGYAFFGNKYLNNAAVGNYALIQHQNGTTYLNSASIKPLSLRQNNEDRLVINTDGNILIGTNSLSASYKLQVGGSIIVTGNIHLSNHINYKVVGTDSTGGFKATSAADINALLGYVPSNHNGSGSNGVITKWTSANTLADSKMMEVGTHSIGIKGSSTGNANQSFLGFYNSTGSERQGYIGLGSTGNKNIYYESVDNIHYFNGSRPLEINTASGKITLRANAASWAMGYVFNGSSNSILGGLWGHGSSNTLTSWSIGTAYTSTFFKILTTGKVSMGGVAQGNYQVTIDSGTTTGDGLYVKGKIETTDTVEFASDRRIKSKIKPVENALEALRKINSYTYLFRYTKKAMGFIAQDVEQVYPFMVRESFGEKKLDYNAMIALTAKGVNELHLRVETSEEKIKRLEKEVTTLKEKINATST